jgi:hypothetical protein
VQGRGIRLAVDGCDATSFLRIVRVTARDRTSAEAKALSFVQSDWDDGAKARLNRGCKPVLSVDAVALLPWWHRFLGRRRGYIFAPEDDDSSAV